MDIAAAQWAFDRLGRVDRVDVRLTDPARLDDAERAIASRLPAGLAVQRPARRGAQVERMLASFQFNLAALSWVALLVGLFLVYNTVATSVIAEARARSACCARSARARATVLALFLGEALALGSAGCACGHRARAGPWRHAAVRLTVHHGDRHSTWPTRRASPALSGVGRRWARSRWACRCRCSRGVARRSRRAASRRSTRCVGGAKALDRRASACAGAVIGALVLFAGGRAGCRGRRQSTACRSSGSSRRCSRSCSASRSSCPPRSSVLGRARRRALGRGSASRAAGDAQHRRGDPAAVACSVAALAVSLSMLVAIAVMIGSFRETVDLLGGADAAGGPVHRHRPSREPRRAADHLGGAGVSASPRDRGCRAPSIGSRAASTLPYEGRLVVARRRGLPTVLLDARRGWSSRRRATAPPSLARRDRQRRRRGLRELRRCGSACGAGRRRDAAHAMRGRGRFRVVAVYYDYSTDRGVVLMDRRTFARHFGEAAPDQPVGLSAARTRSRRHARRGSWRRSAQRTACSSTRTASLRAEVLRIFDGTFAITYGARGHRHPRVACLASRAR